MYIYQNIKATETHVESTALIYIACLHAGKSNLLRD